jgi:predicted TIM-barrel fold metal-dependent hydrolase
VPARRLKRRPSHWVRRLTASVTLPHAAIDCHVHVFDPVRFPYASDAAARRAILWDTPHRLFGFGLTG